MNYDSALETAKIRQLNVFCMYFLFLLYQVFSECEIAIPLSLICG